MACLLGRAQASLTLLSLRCAIMKTWWLACSAELKQAWLCSRCAVPKPTHLWTFVTWFYTIFAPKNEGRTTAHLLRGDFISGAKLLFVWELRNKKGWFLLGDGHIFLPTTARRFSRLGGLESFSTDTRFLSTDLTDHTDACIVTLAAGGCAECKREATCLREICEICVRQKNSSVWGLLLSFFLLQKLL